MISFGGGFVLLVLAIYCVFFTESGWLKLIGGAYIAFFFIVSIIAAFQSTEPLLNLAIPGLVAGLIFYAYSINKNWKDWP
jgi:hypothetical protein